ncbi:MAG: hypothetical protein KKI09_04470 [Spirochaetes bacterium]|nr:hypothetical protein [Spirochaetota bacterium]MBU0954665.1 hypothetical protein [Spirochaetota bacterium]
MLTRPILKRPLLRSAFCFLFAFITLAVISGQNLVERTVCVFDFAPLGETDPTYSRICGDTISIQLETLGYIMVDSSRIRSSYSGPLTNEAAMLESARQLGADVMVSGFYVIDSTGIHIGVKASDILTGLPAVALSESGNAGFEVFDTIDSVSALVASRIREALKPLPASEVVVEREEIIVETTVVEEIVGLGTPITIMLSSKDEGAEVRAGERVLGIISEGQLSLDTIQDTRLDLSLSKAGFFNREYSFVARAEKATVALPRLKVDPRNQLQVQLSAHKPYGAMLEYQRPLLRNVLVPGLGTGFHYIPFAYEGQETPYLQAADGYGEDSWFGNIPLVLNLRFYPLNIFSSGGWWMPFVKLGFQGEVFLVNYLGQAGLPAYQLSSELTLGQTLAFGHVFINTEIGWNIPLWVYGMSADDDSPLIVLTIGAGYRW